jgi:hypothetical protein
MPHPLSRPVVDIDRLDLKCRQAEQATLSLLAIVGCGISSQVARSLYSG